MQFPAQLGKDRPRTPAGMGSPQRDDHRLDLGGDLMGATIGAGAAVGEGAQALVRVAQEPSVDGPSVDAVTGSDVGDLGTVEHLSHREVALLNHRKLREHPEILPCSDGRK